MGFYFVETWTNNYVPVVDSVLRWNNFCVTYVSWMCLCEEIIWTDKTLRYSLSTRRTISFFVRGCFHINWRSPFVGISYSKQLQFSAIVLSCTCACVSFHAFLLSNFSVGLCVQVLQLFTAFKIAFSVKLKTPGLHLWQILYASGSVEVYQVLSRCCHNNSGLPYNASCE